MCYIQTGLNLPFLAKVNEKVSAKRLSDHFTMNNLHELRQSACQPFHSTKTVLIEAQHQLVEGLTENKAALVVMLDYTQQPLILWTRIFSWKPCGHSCMGITGQALPWLRSHLHGRSYRVCLHGGSHVVTEAAAVWSPSGLVLGSLLFAIYTMSFAAVMESRGAGYDRFADDQGLLTFYTPSVLGDLHGGQNDRDETLHQRHFQLDCWQEV